MSQNAVFFEFGEQPTTGDCITVPVTNKYGAVVLVQVTLGDELDHVRRYVNPNRPPVINRAYRAEVDPKDRTRATAANVVVEVSSANIETPEDRRKTAWFRVGP